MSAKKVEMRKSESGVLIQSQNGRFVFTPTGFLDISKLVEGIEPDQQTTVNIKRSKQFLLALSANGEMFVSPAGEVNLDSLQAVAKDWVTPRLTVSRGEKLVVSVDGTLQKEIQESYSPKPPRVLKRESSLVLDPRKIKATERPVKKQEVSTNEAKEVILTQVDTGELVVSPSGSVCLPSLETPRVLPQGAVALTKTTSWLLSLDKEGDLVVISTDNSDISLQVDVDNWIQLF